jgi:hypothetical protein
VVDAGLKERGKEKQKVKKKKHLLEIKQCTKTP